jgi:tetratricopeptide (TPR) repeat protein
MFAGRKPPPTLEEMNVVREQTWARLSRFAKDFGGGREFPPVETRYFRRAARHLGLLANNLGVLLEDAGQPEEAGRAYRMALDFDAQNSSALCNLLGLLPEEAERENWLVRLRRVIKKRQLSPGQMTTDYGFIRDPRSLRAPGPGLGGGRAQRFRGGAGPARLGSGPDQYLGAIAVGPGAEGGAGEGLGSAL